MKASVREKNHQLQTSRRGFSRRETVKMFGSAFSGGGSVQNPNKDMAVAQPPNDSISKLAFSPTANYLIGSSWDNNV